MTEPLPIQTDFFTHPDDLDGNCAWENFGGLTLEEAHALFADNPMIYQEDFMFMGTTAFLYYVPVLESHLRMTFPTELDEHGEPWVIEEAWIIAHIYKHQFEADEKKQLRHLIPGVLDLARYVLHNVSRFGFDEGECRDITKAWTEMVQYVESLESGPN